MIHRNQRRIPTCESLKLFNQNKQDDTREKKY